MSPIITFGNRHTVEYIDTSFLLSRKNIRHLDDMENIRLIPEVIQEIRDGRDVYFNSVLDSLLKRALVVSRSTFDQVLGTRVYDMLLSFATRLHPYLKDRIDNIDLQGLPAKESHRRKMEEVAQVSRNAAIWKADIEWRQKKLPQLNSSIRKMDRYIAREDRFAFDSWHKYHRNRFRGLLRNKYRWTDEKLFATAATEAFVCGMRAIITTQDSDLHTILFQFDNNFVLHRLAMQTPTGQAPGSDFWQQFTQKCQEFNSYKMSLLEQRYNKVLSDYQSRGEKIDFYTLALKASRRRDILIFYHERDYRDVAMYPQEMINGVLDASGIIRKA